MADSKERSAGPVWVHLPGNDRKKALYWEAEVWDLRRSRDPYPGFEVLRGRVCCGEMLKGELGHSCGQGEGTHGVEVVIDKRGNDPKVYARLAERAIQQEVRRGIKKARDREAAGLAQDAFCGAFVRDRRWRRREGREAVCSSSGRH